MPEIKIQDAVLEESSNKNFGPNVEKAIISLIFDQPEFMMAIMPYMKIDFFQTVAAKQIFNIVYYFFEKNQQIITRALCRDQLAEALTAEVNTEEVFELVDRESEPREVPIIRDIMSDWAKKKAYGQIFSEETNMAYENNDFAAIEKIIEEAHKISSMNAVAHSFFDETDELFVESVVDHLTTGFPALDKVINEGGPARKETFCWMAPTGVGKSIALVNSGAANIKRGKNVLHITLEMSWQKTAERYLGCFTDIAIKDRVKHRTTVESRLAAIKATYQAELYIAEFAPDEISTDTIHAMMDNLRRTRNLQFDVVVIDYLELMLSRVPANNKDEYIRQKRVSTEVSRLAFKENVLCFTASQTNRSGNEGQDSKGSDKVIDISKVAESYGKTMPLSYIVTINQSKQEYEHGLPKDSEGKAIKVRDGKEIRNTNAMCRFYVIKNRNGAKFQIISVRINYETMGMKETDFVGTDTAKVTEE
jgi:replicative DNA helicase